MNSGDASRLGKDRDFTATDRARIHAAIDRLIDASVDAKEREKAYLNGGAMQSQGGIR
jgi:hypothetical protein